MNLQRKVPSLKDRCLKNQVKLDLDYHGEAGFGSKQCGQTKEDLNQERR